MTSPMTTLPLAQPDALPQLTLGRRAAWWLLGIALWTLFPLMTALQAAFYSAYVGDAVQWNRLLPLRLADWYTCALFTPLLFWLARRFPVERGAWVRNALAHFVLISVMVVAKFALYVEVARWIRPSDTWRLDLFVAQGFAAESIAFWSLAGIVHAIEYHRRLRERELRAARLEAELASARLDALTAQLQPHFLFNTLHGVSTLMRRDVDAADDMLTHLGDLLHRTLRRGDRHEIALAEELEILGHYLEIMRIRFQDRLQIDLDVAPGTSEALVPPLVLQPLVENAIQHGISRRPGAGRISIVVGPVILPVLEITVRDDGEGLNGDTREGIGLTNTRRRLRQLYGDDQALDLLPAEGGGSMAVLRMPFHTA